MMIGDSSGNFRNRRIVGMEVDRAFVGDTPHLIDEWQEIPGIWDATRSMVDSSTENGRFILTGSSTPKTKGVMHSGAGRISTIRMRTMSLFESGDSDGRVSIRSLFSGEFQQSLSTDEISLEELISLTVRGGWPRQALLKDAGCRGVVHCYSGSVEMARELVGMGFYLSFTGVITFANARKSHEVLRAVPRDRLMIETDAPYLTPVPHRGKRNDSSYVRYTCETMAQVLGLSFEQTAHLTYENACRCFSIDPQ